VEFLLLLGWTVFAFVQKRLRESALPESLGMEKGGRGNDSGMRGSMVVVGHQTNGIIVVVVPGQNRGPHLTIDGSFLFISIKI
jgi:hypothetical protein